MFLVQAYLILCCLILSYHCYQRNKSSCEGSSCLYLYNGDIASVTWDQSYDACRNEGLEMLRIDSNQTQAAVERLLQDLPKTTQRQIWIGGRRSNINTWRFMNGTAFSKDISDVRPSDPYPYCLYVTLEKNPNPQYYADNCNETASHSRLLCQYDPSETGGCRSADIRFGSKCYMKTQYNGSESYRIDWYKGQTYCSQSDIHGDIAYSYLDNDTLINNIIDLVHPGAESAQLWLGVRKRIWFWKTETDEDTKPINFYNWANETEVDSSDNSCIFIDFEKRYKWISQNCNTSPLKYFVCMKKTTNSTTTTTITTTATTTTKANTNGSKTTTTTTRAHTSTATTSTITSMVITSVHPTEVKTENISRGYIIGIVVGVVVLAVVVGLAVFFMLRKRRKETSTKQSKADEQQYDDVELDGDNDDVIDPYGVVGAENAEKVEVRHKQAPSGDLYAVSSKQVNKIDESKNEEDKNPDVVYAQPKKKKNQKTKNRQENGTAKSGNDVDSEKPSGGETGTGSKHTEHFEAPSGEVYARIIKDGKDTDE